jgi:hypothetical protein
MVRRLNWKVLTKPISVAVERTFSVFAKVWDRPLFLDKKTERQVGSKINKTMPFLFLGVIGDKHKSSHAHSIRMICPRPFLVWILTSQLRRAIG